jgi:NTP pyrophosphatase (non-canonical NTP hydrolase)
VLLEDELGDVFWDYICLLESLEQNGKIQKDKVFKRCWRKFSERLDPDSGADA